jgi:serine/threonine protein kinase/Tol biopolymer transport system component
MTPERWQRMKGVLYEALELPPEQRAEFLDRVCSGEDSLRREVDSLLSSGDHSCSNFLQSSKPRVPLSSGTKLGHYEVQLLLGAGGMGEVYRGHDPRLGRDVAVKILPHLFSEDPERLRRFEQEARAAAALSHPNILAIYDIGTTEEGISYVVSELLDGETLRQCLRRGPLPTRKAVDFGLQMARGLAAAHDKGIIHRDLKPENLFLTKDGHLKILDFGLAKFLNSQVTPPDAQTLTRDTTAGVMMGTVGYMPPEQVRGLTVDQRADIFAAGAVIYEMLSGKRAFQGETTADTIDAILNRDPKPLTETNPAVPPAFERVVQRCLEKNPDERFHSVRDVAYALEAISDVPGSRTSGRAVPPVTGRASNRIRYGLWGFAALLALSVAAAYLYYRRQVSVAPAQEWEQVTNFPDSAVAPALSPDGRMLVFLRGPDTFVSAGNLYLKLLPDGEPFQLTHDGTVKGTPSFSPDGSRIAYTVIPPWDTWVLPVLGGKAELMLPNASGLTWVDDRHILFSEIKSGVHMAVVTSTENRSQERDIYVPGAEQGMAHHSHLSPNHKWVLIAYAMDASGLLPCRLVPFDGSSPARVVGPPGYACTYAGWSPDGNWMFFSASNWTSGFHLWRQKFPDGEPEQLTFGPTEQEGMAVSPDGRSLLTSVGLNMGTVWVHDRLGDRQIQFEGSARLPMDQGSSRQLFSPDGTKLYFLGERNRKEGEDLWLADLSSGLIERPLPGMSVANSFDVSADGKEIAFDSGDADGEPHLWVAALDRRSPPRRLESDVPESNPLFGPAGDLFFLAKEGGSFYICHRPLEGGQRKRVTPVPAIHFQTISGDGKWVVAEAPITGEDVTRGVVAYRLSDGAALRVCYSLCIVRWDGDGHFLYVALPGGGAKGGNYKTFVVPLHHGDSFPKLPAAGIKSVGDLTTVSGVKGIDGVVRPGPDASVYALDRWIPHRNIYRIQIR